MKKVLIVEDEASIAELEKDYLEANGYDVFIEYNGKSGLDNAIKNDYNLIVLDIMLPDLDGYNICREIRKTKLVPIMFVTAKLDDIDKIKAFGLGADDYIVKPFSFYEFVARISAHISRFEKLTSHGEKTKASEIAIKGLKINLLSHTVHLNDTELFLPNKEFELLAFLSQNPDVVFSREKLLNYVWGADSFVELSTVTVHINRLREKIEKDISKPEYIQTVWGVGYKLSAVRLT